MNKENMLKPCPFCGGVVIQPAALTTGCEPDNPRYGTLCATCIAEGPLKDTAEAADAAWNTRTILPDVTEEWQPIETAPDDRWVLVAEAPYEPGPYDAYAAHRHPDGYWMANCGQPVVQSPEPTHWRPLPEPPTIAKDAG